MVRKLITKSLAPLRWAIRFELERRRSIDVHDLEGELQRQSLVDTADFIQQNLTRVDSMDLDLDILTGGIEHVGDRHGLYLEFGVFSGRTINHIARQVS